MKTAPFLDTNILIYAFIDDGRTMKAQEILSEPYITSVQAFNEFANVMRRKIRKDWDEIRTALSVIHRMSVKVISVDVALNRKALELINKYNLAFYDALMIAAALEAESEIFFSEDLQDGLIVAETLRIVNPFRVSTAL